MSLVENNISAPFQIIGAFNTDSNKGSDKQPDLLERFATLTNEAQVLFLQIKEKHNYVNNVCSFEIPEHISSNKQGTKYKLFSRRVRSMINAGLLIRLKIDHVRQLRLEEKENTVHFMLNPNLIRCKEPILANSIWTAYP